MAKHHRKIRFPSRKPRPDDFVVLCDCTCPFWGKRHDNIYKCTCDCGEMVTVCGYCLVAGRRKSCNKCSTLMN